MKVYEAINNVQKDLSKIGIGKDSFNSGQQFKFRGIDAVYNTLSPLLSEHGLCILPRMISRQCDERTNTKGTLLLYVTVEAEFDLVSAEDGSKHTIKTFGEAMDTGDKATNKAMSAAYKYACIQSFAIPTEGDNDADATSHEVISNNLLLENAKANMTKASTLPELQAAYNKAVDQFKGKREALLEIADHKDKQKKILTEKTTETNNEPA